MRNNLRERLTLIDEADKLRCSANLALTLQPFCDDDEAFLYAVEHYVKAAEKYRQAGVGLYARQCFVEAASCRQHLEDELVAQSLNEQAERIPILWEAHDE